MHRSDRKLDFSGMAPVRGAKSYVCLNRFWHVQANCLFPLEREFGLEFSGSQTLVVEELGHSRTSKFGLGAFDWNGGSLRENGLRGIDSKTDAAGEE